MRYIRTTAFMKAVVIAAITICLVFSIAGTPAHADSEGAATVTASALNVRTEPSTSASVVTCLPRGTVVLVTGSSDGWYQVWYQGDEGYMSAEYLSFTSAAQENFGTGTIQGTGVRIRSGPSTGDAVLGTENTGKTMSVTGVSGAWYRVSYNGSTGYVRSDYMTVSAGGSGSAQSAAPKTENTKTQGTGVITGNYVRVRSGPSTGYSILASCNAGEKMTVTGESGDWYAVSYNGSDGYVYKQYLDLSGESSFSVKDMDDTAAITTAVVNMRSGPSTGYTSQRVLYNGAAVTITGKADNWYRVSYNGATGYIRSDYLTTDTQTASAASTGSGDKLVAEAKKYQGTRYVYGGASPSGFDCSGFVYYVYAQCGYSIARTATAQNGMGSYVARSDLAPGDIIIFYNSAKTAIGHAGIYIGNGQFIHASSGSGKVIISNLSETYYNTRYYSARRVA